MGQYHRAVQRLCQDSIPLRVLFRVGSCDFVDRPRVPLIE
jgi:hypothetical protein